VLLLVNEVNNMKELVERTFANDVSGLPKVVHGDNNLRT
jgi:hypothetical protein